MIPFYFVVIFALLFIIDKYKRPKNYPPGPLRHPIIGNMLSMDPSKPSSTFYNWMKEYGDIYSVKLGEQEFVVLNDPSMIREALSSNEFIDRPRNYNFLVARDYKNVGILASGGEVWKENRRFSMRHLRDYGLGKSSIEDIVKNEIVEQISKIRGKLGEPLELGWDFNIAVTNIIWSITAGKRFDTDAEEMKKLHTLIQELFVLQGSSVLLDAFSWLLYLPKTLLQVDKIEAANQKLLQFLKEEIEEHKREYDVKREAYNLIDAYLKKFDEESERSGFDIISEEFNLTLILTDLFVAGGETTYTTLRWAFLFLIKYPELQDEIQKEIDEIVGQDRMPTLSDRDRMIHTEAFIMETQRFSNIAATGVPHRTTYNTIFRGYQIPKDTLILPNLYASHMNPKYWGDPQNFRPCRFIDIEGHIRKHDAFMPFSVGRRVCLGEALARTELFLFITCLLQKFNFRYESNVSDISLSPKNEGFIRYPKHYPMIATVR